MTIKPIEMNAAPQIGNQSFTTVENAPRGWSIGMVEAADPDGDRLSYSIVTGNSGDAFII